MRMTVSSTPHEQHTDLSATCALPLGGIRIYLRDLSHVFIASLSCRYSGDRYSGRETLRTEPVLSHPPSIPVARYDAAQPPYRRYDNFDVAPPGTGPDIPGIGSFEKPRYDRSYERSAPYEVRTTSDEYLTPPGVDSRRSEYSTRERDLAPPGVRDPVPPIASVLRDVSRESWEHKGRDSDNVAVPSSSRDTDRDRRDYYDADVRKSYYNSPDSRKRKQSMSPSRQAGSGDRYSSTERHHRHVRNESRRKVSSKDGGKENRHSSQQPVEALDVSRDRQHDRDKEKDIQKRERVLVEVRKEPSVDKEKSKKDKDEKFKKDEDDKNRDKRSTKDKKKRKKEKDVDADKAKKKKRKERKDGKKDGQENKKEVQGSKEETKSNFIDKSKNTTAVRKDVKKEGSGGNTKNTASAEGAASAIVLKTAQPIGVIGSVAPTEPVIHSLYDDMEDTRIDNNVMANYGKVDASTGESAVMAAEEKSEALVTAGTEVEAGLNSKEHIMTNEGVTGGETKSENVMLAPLPGPSKWELDDELGEDKMGEEMSGTAGDADNKAGNKVVTSEVLKRAENAIFQKAINAIRTIEPAKKSSVGERKVYSMSTDKEKKTPADNTVAETVEPVRKVAEKEAREARKTANSIQITIPIAGHLERSVEMSGLENTTPPIKGKSKLDRSKFTSSMMGGPWGEGLDTTSPHRVPAKERLGAKLEGDGERRRDEDQDKNRRARHRSRSNSRDRKHTTRKGLKSAIERKRTVSRSRSRSPYHRKVISDRKYMVDPMKELKYLDPMKDLKYIEAMQMRYIDQGDPRRYLDPALDRKFLVDHAMRRDMRYAEGDRRLIERDLRRPEKIYPAPRSPERRRSLSRERGLAKVRERTPDRGKHKAKKRTKNRSESRTRKKSLSDKESKRGKKKDKKHKKEKVKKHKIKTDKDEKKEEEKSKTPPTTKETKVAPNNDNTEAEKGKQEKTTDATQETATGKDKSKKGVRRNPRLASDRKKSTLDEASFEPDYDASSSVDTEAEDPADPEKKSEAGEKKQDTSAAEKTSPAKKRERSGSVDTALANTAAEKKRQKVEKEAGVTDDSEAKKSIKEKIVKVPKKKEKSSSSEPDSSEESSDDESSSNSSSSSEDESSDDSSVKRRRKKKASRRHHKKKSKRSRRADTSSDSDSDSDSDDASSSDSGGGRRRGRSSKKHKHHTKSKLKKKKKSKHR
nr:unnamed protein product [Timema californicum]